MLSRSLILFLGASGILADSCSDVAAVTEVTSVTEYVAATTLLTVSSTVATSTDLTTITSAITSTVTETVSSDATPISYVFLPGGPPSSSSAAAASVSAPSRRAVNRRAAPICNADNCLRALRATSVLGQVQAFCAIYTAIPSNPLPLPSFILPPCNPARVTSACSCLAPATSTSTSSSSSTPSSIIALPTSTPPSIAPSSPVAVSSTSTSVAITSSTSTSSSSTSAAATSSTSTSSSSTSAAAPSSTSTSSSSTSAAAPSSTSPSSSSTTSSTTPCTTPTVTSTITVSIPTIAATSTSVNLLTDAAVNTANALVTSFTTTTTTIFPPASTTTGYPCYNIQKYNGPTYGDAHEAVDLQRQNSLYGLKTPEGASTESCCNLCFFGLANCVQAYWYSYQGCVVSQAFNTGAGTGQGVSQTCPVGAFNGLQYGNDQAPAYGSSGNIAGPCGQSYVNFWQT